MNLSNIKNPLHRLLVTVIVCALEKIAIMSGEKLQTMPLEHIASMPMETLAHWVGNEK